MKYVSQKDLLKLINKKCYVRIGKYKCRRNVEVNSDVKKDC